MIGDGEQQQQLQPLAALHQIGEVADGLGVVEVAALGEGAHHQMMLDEPGRGLGLGRREAEPRAELARDAGAGMRMILVAALGDVVQEGRDVERAAIVDGADDLGRDRMLERKLAALDVRQEADGADQMLVDREVMIHVELHHRDHAPEFGDEVAEHAGLVHAAQHAFRIARVGQEPQEEAVGGRIGAQASRRSAARFARTWRRHLGREGRLLLVGKGEQADEVDRVLGEDVLVDGVDAAVLDAEVGGAAKMARGASSRRATEACRGSAATSAASSRAPSRRCG